MRASDKKNKKYRVLNDPDLATSEHDKIMLWLEANLEKILGEKPTRVVWEYPILERMSRSEAIVGFADLWADSTYFEVKSQIRSAGEVIRQIRYYEHFTGGYGPWVVVAPPGPYGEIFERQRIRFVAYIENA